MPNDSRDNTADHTRCRNAVVAIAVLAGLAVAMVMIRGFALPVGPSVLAAAAAGIAVFIGLASLVCRAVPVVTYAPQRGGIQDDTPAYIDDDAVQAAAVMPEAPALMLTEPAVQASAPPLPEVAPEAVAQDLVQTEPAPAPTSDPLPTTATEPPGDRIPAPSAAPASPRQLDKALMMAVAGSRAVHTDRRPSPADARRARAARVSTKTGAASRPAAKIASAARAAAPAAAPLSAKPPTRAADKAGSRPAAKPAKRPQTPTAADDGHPIAGGIDAAIARSHHASPVKTGDVVRLPRPRGGHADDLKLIKGIGPKLEALLNAAGIWHFDQIATWKARDIAEIDAAMTGFHGRITRDGWVKQAREFVAGAAPARKPRKPKTGA